MVFGYFLHIDDGDDDDDDVNTVYMWLEVYTQVDVLDLALGILPSQAMHSDGVHHSWKMYIISGIHPAQSTMKVRIQSQSTSRHSIPVTKSHNTTVAS